MWKRDCLFVFYFYVEQRDVFDTIGDTKNDLLFILYLKNYNKREKYLK